MTLWLRRSGTGAKGTAKGYFLEILSALKESGYYVVAKTLDAQWLGVPQSRQRLIFVGVRNDLGVAPAHPKPLPHRYSARDAIPWIGREVDPTQPFGAAFLSCAARWSRLSSAA